MLVTRFEDLVAWQESRRLREVIYKVSSAQGFQRDREMQSQIRAAALSAMTNIAEGFANESKKEFARFLSMAGRSCSEVQSLLYAALDEHYITEIEFKASFEQARKTRALIGGLRASVRRQIAAQQNKPAVPSAKPPINNPATEQPKSPSLQRPGNPTTSKPNVPPTQQPDNQSTQQP